MTFQSPAPASCGQQVLERVLTQPRSAGGAAAPAHAKTSGGAGTHSWRVSTSGTARYIKPFHTRAGRSEGQRRGRNRSSCLRKTRRSFLLSSRGEGRGGRPQHRGVNSGTASSRSSPCTRLSGQDLGHASLSTGRATKIHSKREQLRDTGCPASPDPQQHPSRSCSSRSTGSAVPGVPVLSQTTKESPVC